MTRIYSYISILVVLLFTSLIDYGLTQCTCYTFDGQYARSWFEARKLCNNNNSDLISMETKEEWEFIKNQIQSKRASKNEWWIGLVKRDEKWIWLNNHSLMYDKWEKGKPEDNVQIKHVRMAKGYPPGTYGLFANIRSDIKRGTICEYKKSVCKSRSNTAIEWCPPTTPSISTRIITSSTPIKTFNISTKAVTQKGYSPSTTTHSTLSTSFGKYTRKTFPTVTVASVVCVLLMLSVCLLVFVCTWKRRAAEPKPRRNSNLSQKYRVPVKLEQSQSLVEANDLIVSTDVMNMTRLNSSCSTFPVLVDNNLQPEVTYTSINKHNADPTLNDEMSRGNAPFYASVNETNSKFNQETITDQSKNPNTTYVNQLSCQGSNNSDNQQVNNNDGKCLHIYEGIPSCDGNHAACIYATVDKSSKTPVKDNALQYAKLEEFKNEKGGSAKKPHPYIPTEYATILEPVIFKRSKSKEDLSQVHV